MSRYAVAGPSAVRAVEDDELDLGKIWDNVWGGRWIILAATLLALLFSGLYLVMARPIFIANGLVQVEEGEQGMTPSMEELTAVFGGGAKTSAELEILKSRMVVGKVVDDLLLEIHAEPLYFPVFGRFWARKNWGLPSEDAWWKKYSWGDERIEVSRFNVPASMLGQSFVLVSEGAKFQLLDPQLQPVLQGAVGELAVGQLAGEPLEIFVKDLSAEPGTHFAVVRRSRQAALGDVIDRLKVAEQGRQSGVITLTVEDYSPTRAANIVRSIQDAYLRQNVERRSAEAKQSLDFLQEQLPAIKEKVDSAQTQLNAYQVSQQSVDVTRETEIILQQSVELETRRLELQQQRQSALQRFTAQHPVIVAIDAQLARIAGELGNVKKQSETLPSKQQEILSLMRDLEVNSQIYTTMLNSAQELQVAKAGTVGNVRIIDYPLVPAYKSLPKSGQVIAIGLLLGVFLGICLVFLKQAINKGVSDPAHVETALGLPSYAAVPYSRKQRGLRKAIRGGKDGFHILAIQDPSDVAVEALRSLRTSLQFALLESKNNVLMLTGPTPGIGKSFISMNLAAVLASTGKKIAVIDGDLRRSTLHKYSGISQTPGITDFVLGRVEAAQIAKKTPIQDLTVFPRGTVAPNPAELLLHPRFGELITTLSKYYDLVIIDAPPVLPVTDACVIGAHAGCTLIVLKDHEHPMPAIDETVRRLQHAGVNPKGVVFNQMGRSPGSYGYRAYGSYRYDQKYS